MASRNFNRKQALEKEIKEIYALLTFGGSGAVTLTTGHGVASATKTDTGDYRITLQDIRVQVKAEDVASAKTIDILTLTGASATNPSSGAKLLLKFELKNTTVV
jgi:hypothetical protein